MCYGGNTSVAPLMHKEMSLSLLTLPTLHTPQAALHHPSLHHVRNSLYFLLVLCQQGENNSKKGKCIYTSAVSSSLHLSSILHSYPCLPLNSPWMLPLLYQGCCSLPLSARPSAHSFPPSIMCPCCLYPSLRAVPQEEDMDGSVGIGLVQDLKSSMLSSYFRYLECE